MEVSGVQRHWYSSWIDVSDALRAGTVASPILTTSPIQLRGSWIRTTERLVGRERPSLRDWRQNVAQGKWPRRAGNEERGGASLAKQQGGVGCGLDGSAVQVFRWRCQLRFPNVKAIQRWPLSPIQKCPLRRAISERTTDGMHGLGYAGQLTTVTYGAEFSAVPPLGMRERSDRSPSGGTARGQPATVPAASGLNPRRQG